MIDLCSRNTIFFYSIYQQLKMNKMMYISFLGFVSVLCLAIRVDARAQRVTGIDQNKKGFDENYVITWGEDHILKLNQGKEVQLSMDKASGSGFGSKNNYTSGYFSMKIKLPPRDSAGVVTAYYLTSKGNTQDEIDFEFLGNREGKPIGLQTNIITNGYSKREQRFHFWFDPTQDFHTYDILWNPYQIVLYVDKIPIRVYKKLTSQGIDYPTKPSQVIVSLWNGEGWATDGGKEKINWSFAPFKANFQEFENSGCFVDGGNEDCGSSAYWWNSGDYTKLSDSDYKAYQNVRKNNMYYDYCTDKARFQGVTPPECASNQ